MQTFFYNAACGYGVMRMKAEAMSTLCVEAGCFNSGSASKHPDLAILHDDPEFQKLVVARPGARP